MDILEMNDFKESVKENKCILFIGPYAYKNKSGQYIEEALNHYLKEKRILENDRYGIKSYDQLDNFYLAEDGGFFKLVNATTRFYNSVFEPNHNFLKKIAQIPFSLIISLTPDNYLRNTFNRAELNLEYEYDKYDKEKKPQYYPSTSKKPLIYNLLGSIDNNKTLILTHKNFFDYLKSLFGGKKIHNELRIQLKEGTFYIFLGLPLDKWYTQLLLRLLQLDIKGKYELYSLASKHGKKSHQELYKDQFRFEMIDYEVEEFIDKLYEKCKVEDILKKGHTKIKNNIHDNVTSSNTTFDKRDIRVLLTRSKVKEAISKLEIFFKNTSNKELSDIFTLILSSYYQSESEIMAGTITKEHYDSQRQQLIKKLISFIEKIKY